MLLSCLTTVTGRADADGHPGPVFEGRGRRTILGPTKINFLYLSIPDVMVCMFARAPFALAFVKKMPHRQGADFRLFYSWPMDYTGTNSEGTKARTGQAKSKQV